MLLFADKKRCFFDLFSGLGLAALIFSGCQLKTGQRWYAKLLPWLCAPSNPQEAFLADCLALC